MPTEKTVLVVDDSLLSRTMLRTMILGAQPDWNIIEASNGTDALEKAAATQVDFMTIDLNMPGMDGLTLSSLLRQKHASAHMALVTANIQDAVRERAEALGIEFIPKPITEDNVLSWLSRMEPNHA